VISCQGLLSIFFEKKIRTERIEFNLCFPGRDKVHFIDVLAIGPVRLLCDNPDLKGRGYRHWSLRDHDIVCDNVFQRAKLVFRTSIQHHVFLRIILLM
jgi:hypothetical protein